MSELYLLWRDLVSRCSQVNLLVDINTRNDEEDPRTPSSSCQQPAQPEDDGPLVLLDHLDGEEEGEGEGAENDEDGGDGDEEGAYSRTLLTSCGYKKYQFEALLDTDCFIWIEGIPLE